ncbi:accessory gene regulator ArgB-like protein [Sedimentibacter sp. MB31-C6]|uniref:accessory gene regulator ArgB-like protein n=1 Tax=Sedimentibacter sp. MB31-C6 TaxID=3109366 RepID=UPI002DDCF95F|nr:accessory gene regulator B family protein [Sedimentibacter sp. MB36-C1]WSI05218.1 accessory gene regulator B family protein [Sedimentibacter sp. MB36-C1]
MINYLTNNITEYFCSNNIITDDEKDIYIYGLQLIISSVVGIILIISLGFILNNIINSILFLITFISIRMYSGGYHANSYIKCNVSLVIIYLLSIVVISIIPYNYISIMYISMIILTIYIIIKYSPVDNKNKKLTNNQKKRNKKVTLILLFTFYLIGIATYKINSQIFYTIIVTMFFVAALIIKKIIEEGGVTNE